MSIIAHDTMTLGYSFLGLRPPDEVLGIVCAEDALSPHPIFTPGATDALALLLPPELAAEVFATAATLLESAERAEPGADECGTSFGLAKWNIDPTRTLVIAADTAGCDTAQHELHTALDDRAAMARYQSAHFVPALCTQPYLTAVFRNLWLGSAG